LIKALIFDLAGTIADTLPDLMSSMNAALSDCGFPTRTKEEILLAIGKGAKEFVCASLPPEHQNNPETNEKCLALYKKHYNEQYLNNTVPFKGIPELLKRLNEEGYLISVLSNKPDEKTVSIVTKLFPDIKFFSIRGQTDLPTKPDPTVPIMMAKQMVINPADIAFVGDSDIDMQTGVNSGMTAIGVTWGYRPKQLLIDCGADFIADTPDEILDYIYSLK